MGLPRYSVIFSTSSGRPATRIWVSAAKTNEASMGRTAPPSFRPMTFTFHRLRMSRSMMVRPKSEAKRS